MRPGSASAPASRAASSTVRVNVPTVSNVSLNGFTPAVGMALRVGLNTITPPYAARRQIEPFVCVPMAAATWPTATAAADPEDDPPGVYAGSHGLRVLPGSRN